MTRKDQFLRAIQLTPRRGTHDLPLAFGLALNLAEQSIPKDLPGEAEKFVVNVSSAIHQNGARGSESQPGSKPGRAGPRSHPFHS
jgi:hypothetical protein